VTVVWRDGSLYPPRPPEITDPNAWPFDTSGQLWIGDGGRLIAGIYGENPKLLDAAKQAEVTAHPIPQKYARTEGVYAEWIAACKGGTQRGPIFPTSRVRSPRWCCSSISPCGPRSPST